MKFLRVYILLMILLMFFSCNNSEMKTSTESSALADTSVMAPIDQLDSIKHFDTSDSSISPTDRPAHEPDEPGSFQRKKREAVFGYSFFKKIQQNESRPVYAYVSIINAISKVIDTLKQINATEIPERKSDTAVIFARNMFVFKAISVHLINAGDSDFIIKSFSEPRQIIDSLDGNSWSWEVTLLTHKKNSKLIMNVVVEKPDGSREPFSIINIPIVIQLDKQIGRIIWDWIMRNPEKAITIIIIPFIIFFRKQITCVFKKSRYSKRSIIDN